MSKVIKNDIKAFLLQLGLNDTETTIYLALISLGPSTVQQVAEQSNFKRASVYPHIESLKDKGFIIETRGGRRRLLVAEPAENLLIILEKTKQKLRELEGNLPNIINGIKKLEPTTTKQKPSIVFYEGIDGVKRIYEDTLTAKTDILAWFPAQSVDKALGKYHFDYIHRRVEKGIWARGILLDDKMKDFLQEKSPEHLREPVFLPQKKYGFTNEINIYNDKVAIMSTKGEFIGVIIKNQEFADTMRAIHKTCWDYAKFFGK